MSSLKRITSSGKGPSSSENRITRSNNTLKLKSANDDLKKIGVHNVISLSDESSMSEEVECLAADFAQITKGEIQTAVSPISLRLKKEEETKGISLGHLKLIADKLKITKKPFMRFERVQIMYSPLFNGGEDDSSEILIELIDESRSEGKEVISSVVIKGGSMSLSEVSMNFMVKASDVHMIKLRFTASGIDVNGRSYGVMMIAFFVHSDHNPSKYEVKESMTLVLDDLERPKDINSNTVFSRIGERVQADIKEKRGEYRRKKREMDNAMRKKKNKLAIEDNEENGDEETVNNNEIKEIVKLGKMKIENDESDDEWEEETITIGPTQVRKEVKKDGNVKRTENTKTRVEYNDVDLTGMTGRVRKLDTGSPNHYIYNPNILTDQEMKNVLGIECLNFTTVKETKINLGGRVVIILNARHTSDKIGEDIISMDELKDQGLVDRFSLMSEDALLYKNEKVIWELDMSTVGQLKF